MKKIISALGAAIIALPSFAQTAPDSAKCDTAFVFTDIISIPTT